MSICDTCNDKKYIVVRKFPEMDCGTCSSRPVAAANGAHGLEYRCEYLANGNASDCPYLSITEKVNCPDCNPYGWNSWSDTEFEE